MENERIVGLIRGSTEEVFSMMLGLPVEPLEWHEELAKAESFDGIVSLVGIGGPWTGTGILYCGLDLALELTGTMLMQEQTTVNEEVLDAMAELANMIIGNVKTSMEAELGPLVLSIPTVIFGRNYRALNGAGKSRVVVPFLVCGKRMEVKFCLIRSDEGGGRLSAIIHATA